MSLSHWSSHMLAPGYTAKYENNTTLEQPWKMKGFSQRCWARRNSKSY